MEWLILIMTVCTDTVIVCPWTVAGTRGKCYCLSRCGYQRYKGGPQGWFWCTRSVTELICSMFAFLCLGCCNKPNSNNYSMKCLLFFESHIPVFVKYFHICFAFFILFLQIFIKKETVQKTYSTFFRFCVINFCHKFKHTFLIELI